ncbi:MAG: gluconate 2-dehydrogenase subunit 3 family protein [Opitutaceae bacterium]|nr:gluconate 2-dehydrogenase subunit 3 family protein [Opitutaceae bacterium]
MNSSPSSIPPSGPSGFTRREAIKRAALILGVAISPSILAGVMRGQAVAAAPPKNYLTPKERETAAAAAERIIPRTDTPGATDVGVPAFMDLMYGEYLSDEEKRVFADGLAELDRASTAAKGRSFGALSPAQQDALLRDHAEAGGGREQTFFYVLKELTVVGYFTSETVGKTVLRYDPIPGAFQGCIPLSEVGKASWTPLR